MTALVCDIGGTNTRLGLVEAGRLVEPASFANDGFSDFPTLLDTYVSNAGRPAIGTVCIALAAVATTEGARLTNRDWDIRHGDVAAVSGAARVLFINDFEALGFALVSVDRVETQPLFGPAPALAQGTRLVMGAGTGFNASACFAPRFGDSPHVSAAECGHMTLPIAGEAELSLQTHLSRGRSRASVERALSGSGLVEIYQWCCVRQGSPVRFRKAAEVSAAALDSSDAQARQAAEIVIGLFGRVAGDLALAFLPSAGIYLAGGVTRALAPLVRSTPAFRQSFLAKGRQSQFMETFPVSLMLDDQVALYGCVEFLRLSGDG